MPVTLVPHSCHPARLMYSVIVANAPDLDLVPYLDTVRSADLVIAADGGAIPLLRAGVLPHVVVGDLDSLNAPNREVLAARGVELRRFPRDKDETDFELALLLAVEREATAIDVLGALGGRWDHTLANIWLLAHPMLIGRQIRLITDRQTVFVVRDHVMIEGRRGDTVSLLPLTPEVRGVTTTGLRYPLKDATLRADQARGVSNVLLEPPGQVHVREGMLVVVQHDDNGALQWNAPNLG